ncbi:formate dehydrogenase accessory protein FdhE [Providencia sneebia]|uniref:Protein FdhE homolog n=1 Tax=Providencia sneebia DSM 19967 TaxID=1141660 RepID=K8WYS9_9GAMM|nr:formate dehydrogenase accessory protein FdhE [Providencia sneebia]EKT61360.1 formate dehydrogenase accessory protein FdhE [Providencia sneebia DSM 19967]
MGIRIVPKEDLGQERLKEKGIGFIPPVLFPNLKNLYQRRAERLKQLAIGEHPFADYLNFAADVAMAQNSAQFDNPLEMDMNAVLAHATATNTPPLDTKTFPRTHHWHKILQSIIAELLPVVPETVRSTLENLSKESDSELKVMASALLNEQFEKVPADKSMFIWAALSVYWAQMAAQIPGKARAEEGDHRHFCPVCHSMPVSSIVQIGSSQGLRYLHCNLCETEWHMVRVKCSNCEETRDLNYWSLDDENAAVKAESCGDCGSYLKILYQEKEVNVEAVADDLASIILDARMEEEGFARSSINPFLFPGEK